MPDPIFRAAPNRASVVFIFEAFHECRDCDKASAQLCSGNFSRVARAETDAYTFILTTCPDSEH